MVVTVRFELTLSTFSTLRLLPLGYVTNPFNYPQFINKSYYFCSKYDIWQGEWESNPLSGVLETLHRPDGRPVNFKKINLV
jgi:hypothetical protein